MSSSKTTPLRILLFAFLILPIIALLYQNQKLRQETDRLTNPYKVGWQYFDDDWNLDRFLMQYPKGWIVDNVNHPRQYVFTSPDIKEDVVDGQMKIVKGGWISLSIEEARIKDIQNLREEIENKDGIEEIKETTFIGQEALWYREINKTTSNYRVRIFTVKDNLEYSLLLIYNPQESNTEQYYYVFNEIARRFSSIDK